MTPDQFTPTDDAVEDRIPDYEALRRWGDRRLLDAYRRLSRDLRRRGFDEGTVHRMGRVEVELRDRGFDPDEIARVVDGGEG